MNRTTRIILTLYSLSIAAACLWVPWRWEKSVVSFPPIGFGLIWSGPSYPSAFSQYELDRWRYQQSEEALASLHPALEVEKSAKAGSALKSSPIEVKVDELSRIKDPPLRPEDFREREDYFELVRAFGYF